MSRTARINEIRQQILELELQYASLPELMTVEQAQYGMKLLAKLADLKDILSILQER